jgi:hypothetical protein
MIARLRGHHEIEASNTFPHSERSSRSSRRASTCSRAITRDYNVLSTQRSRHTQSCSLRRETISRNAVGYRPLRLANRRALSRAGAPSARRGGADHPAATRAVDRRSLYLSG